MTQADLPTLKGVFQNNYRRSNILQKWLFLYGNPLIKAVQDNGGKLKLESVENLNLTDTESNDLIITFETTL